MFASGEPVSLARLAEVLELDEETALRLAEDLKNDYNTRAGGLGIVRLDDRYQMVTRRTTPIISAKPWISAGIPPSPRRRWRCWRSWLTTSR